MSRRQGAVAGHGGRSLAAGGFDGKLWQQYLTVVADNCSNPETVAGPIRTLGGVVSARVVDCRGFAWTEVCEDYGLFVGECLRALNIPAAVLDRWLRRVARRHGVCAGWEMYDVCLEEEVGKAREDILRLQRAAKPWLLPYADVSPDLAFQDSGYFSWGVSSAELTRRTGNIAPRFTNDKASLDWHKTIIWIDDKQFVNKSLKEGGP